MDGIFKRPAPLSLSGNINDNWKKFKNNFEIFLSAAGLSDKTDERKIAILLNAIGEEAVELYNTFNLPEEQRKNFRSVINAFETYACPKANLVVERYKLNIRKQEEGETFDTFVTDLKKLIQTCEYGEQTNSIMRDRIVLGIYDKATQERLLRENDLELERTLEVCRAAELSKKQAELISKPLQVEAINTTLPLICKICP